jgi:hypothetical protein
VPRLCRHQDRALAAARRSDNKSSRSPPPIPPPAPNESVTSHRLIGSPPLSRIRVRFWVIRVAQRTPSSQRPQHVRAPTREIGIPQPLVVSTPGSQAVGSPGRPVRSVPWAHGPSESMPVRAIRVSGSRAVSCLSQRKAPRPLVSQPVGRCSAASVPRGRRTNKRAPGLMTSGYQGIRGLCHRLPCIADLSHRRIRARSSDLHLTDESARADPDQGPRLRHRGLRALANKWEPAMS